MEVPMVLRVLGVWLPVVLLLGSVERSECVRCFARFSLGQCYEELGEVDQDDCCQNPHYGYQATDRECQSCGPPLWSTWSPWSQCSVTCGNGVVHRRRTCFGIGKSNCGNSEDRIQLEAVPCNGTCCNAEGWGLWTSWSTCSVTCGGGGVKKRERVCSSSPKCNSICSGPSEDTENCPLMKTCPVHGGWSSWSGWSGCSGSCISDVGGDVINPTRERRRFCSNPAPSSDTVPPGNSCPGDDTEVQDCSNLPNCPVNGGWGAWGLPRPCSVSCGEGLQLSLRLCDSPPPKYGGQYCDGLSTKTSICQSPCPVDGFWTGWSLWSECSSCIPAGQVPVRTRHRTCSNPAPSSSPRGKGCQGDDRQTKNCDHLPHCPVDGGWGSWTPFSPCSVTCGVGLQVSVRKCDSPANKHGGQPCPGEARRTIICRTNAHCPVDGVWSEWTPWKPCKFPFGSYNINCKQVGGSQTRERQCLHRAHNGSICSGTTLTERRVCYDVNGCPMKGSWDGWEPWNPCQASCGVTNSRRVRRRFCKPDYSEYSPTIGRLKEIATFFGRPTADCGAAPGGMKHEVQECLNLPPCP